MKQKSKVRESSEYAKSPCISTVFPFGALAPDGRESGHQWHSRGQRFDPAYLHHRKSHRKPFGLRCFSLFLGKFQTLCTKLVFAQKLQNGHLSTKFVNKLRYWRQKGMVHRNKLQQKKRPAIAGRLSRKEKLMSAPIAL